MRASSRANEAILGVSRWALATSSDGFGEHVDFEEGRNLPFACRRVFTIHAGGGGADRGGHANSCDELIVALTGSVVVRVDNGLEQDEIRLDGQNEALWVRGGVLIDLCEFAPRTTLLVCASAAYVDTKHFDAPQPQLLS